ncbi:MAG: response regulator transcription factor [Myxococcales bacterium]
MLVEDDPAVAEAVRVTLEDLGCRVIWKSSVRDALAVTHDGHGDGFDAAVLDVGLPDGHGFDVLEALRRCDEPCAAVVMTGNPNDRTVAYSIRAGVSEFLAKPFHGNELASAVRRCLQTTREFRARMARARGGDSRDTFDGDGGSSAASVRLLPRDAVARVAHEMAAEAGLTDRERETLDLILAGLQNADIASALEISSNTVKYHVRNVLTKLGLKSRTELFRVLLHRHHVDTHG